MKVTEPSVRPAVPSIVAGDAPTPASAPASGRAALPARTDAFSGTVPSRASNLIPARASSVPSNNFQHATTGPVPAKVGGGFFTQLGQANELRKLSSMAAESRDTNGRLPTRSVVDAKLRSLDRTPVDRGQSVTRSRYQSQIPNVPPGAVFDRFLAKPEEVFGAAGLKLRPGGGPLRDGARVMIEDGGPPAAWLPVEVRVNAASKEITFHTLDGHPLRGSNSFRFDSDGKGGTRIHQQAEFQFSSGVAKLGNEVLGGTERQNATWKAVHANLFSAAQQSSVRW